MRAAGALVQNSLELLVDAERELRRVLAYPLAETLASAGAAPVLEDNFLEAGPGSSAQARVAMSFDTVSSLVKARTPADLQLSLTRCCAKRTSKHAL